MDDLLIVLILGVAILIVLFLYANNKLTILQYRMEQQIEQNEKITQILSELNKSTD